MRISYADYKQLNIKANKNSYDATTKTIDVETKIGWTNYDLADYFDSLNMTKEEWIADGNNADEFDGARKEIEDFLADELGSNWEIMKKYF